MHVDVALLQTEHLINCIKINIVSAQNSNYEAFLLFAFWGFFFLFFKNWKCLQSKKHWFFNYLAAFIMGHSTYRTFTAWCVIRVVFKSILLLHCMVNMLPTHLNLPPCVGWQYGVIFTFTSYWIDFESCLGKTTTIIKIHTSIYLYVPLRTSDKITFQIHI